MTWLDIAVVVTVGACAAFGFWRGIVRTIIGIAGLLGGILLAGAFHQHLAQLIWPTSGSWSLVVSYMIILLATVAVTVIVATLVGRAMHQTPFGLADRLLGLVLGALIAIGTWALALTILLLVLPGGRELIADSPIATAVIRMITAMRGLPPHTGEPAQIA